MKRNGFQKPKMHFFFFYSSIECIELRRCGKSIFIATSTFSSRHYCRSPLFRSLARFWTLKNWKQKRKKSGTKAEKGTRGACWNLIALASRWRRVAQAISIWTGWTARSLRSRSIWWKIIQLWWGEKMWWILSLYCITPFSTIFGARELIFHSLARTSPGTNFFFLIFLQSCETLTKLFILSREPPPTFIIYRGGWWKSQSLEKTYRQKYYVFPLQQAQLESPKRGKKENRIWIIRAEIVFERANRIFLN